MLIGRIQNSGGEAVANSADLGNITAGGSKTKKLFLQNDLSRDSSAVVGAIAQYGSSNLYNLMKWALCTDTLSCPFNVAAELLSGGSLAASTTYYYRITAYNSLGETTGSIEVSATTTSVNKTIKLTWLKVDGSAGYLIYRSTTSGSYASSRRMVIESPDTLEWTDDNATYQQSGPYSFPGINTDFDLPSENTTAGEGPDYGTAPTLNTGGLSVGVLKPGQQKAFWVGAYTLVSTPQDPSASCQIDFTET